MAAPPRPRRGRAARLAAVLLLALAALAAGAFPLSAQDEGVFELRAQALPGARTLTVPLDSAGHPFLPLAQVLDFLEIPVRREGEALVLEWPPGVWRTRVDLAARTVEGAGAEFAVPAAGWRAEGGEVYVSAAALERILAARVRVEWENVIVWIEGRDDFPAVLRLRNAQAREANRRATGGALLRPGEPDVPYPPRSGGVTGAWGVSQTWTDGGASAGTARAAVGFGVLGGGLEAGSNVSWSTRGATRAEDPYLSYARGFPGSSWVRQLRVGDVLTDGLLVRPVTGFAVSNEPLWTPTFFGEALVRPVVPAGWEAEVYQGDYLVGVSQGGGAPVAAPLSYGITPLRVRLVGPAGQERVQELVFLVPATQIPEGEWRWYAGGGRCRFRCDWLGYADVRRGITRDVTAGVGVDRIDGDSVRLTRPFGILSVTPLPGLRGEVRARHRSFLHALVQQTGGWGQWQAATGWTRGEVEELATPSWYAEAGGSTRLVRGRTETPVTGQLRVRGPEAGRVEAYTASLGAVVRRVEVTAGYESGFQPFDLLTLRAYSFFGNRVRRFADLSVTAQTDVRREGLYRASLGLAFRPFPASALALSVNWFEGSRAPSVSLSLISRSRAAYVQSHAFRGPDQSTFAASAGGGVVYDRELGVTTSPFETIGRSGVAGRVFLDADGDGRYDAGETVMDSVPVVVGGDRAISRDGGLFGAWGTQSYAVVNVGVDTLNLPTTTVAPTRTETLVRPTPNLYTRIDLPLVAVREVEGRVAWRGTPGPLGGIGVELRREGGEPLRASTFSDGGWLLNRVPAGRYVARVSPSSLRVLGAEAQPDSVVFVVPSAGEDVSLTAPTLYLARPGERAPDVPRPRADTVALPSADAAPGPSPDTVARSGTDALRPPADSLAPPAADASVPTGEAGRGPSPAPAPADGGVEIASGDSLVLGRVYFDVDRATLRDSSRTVLDAVAARLRAAPAISVTVDGHTDETGTRAYNVGLARRRARAVASYLAQAGIAPERLVVRVFGETVPAATNRTRDGRQLNRRTEVRRALPTPPTTGT